jgi:SAM-dependent methyltransferase
MRTIEKYAVGKDLLDYGCYTGWMVERYAAMGPKSITGIDISEIGIQQAIKDYGHLGKFYAADAHNMPFPDNSFEVIVGRAILHHLDFESRCTRSLERYGPAVERFSWSHLGITLPRRYSAASRQGRARKTRRRFPERRSGLATRFLVMQRIDFLISPLAPWLWRRP